MVLPASLPLLLLLLLLLLAPATGGDRCNSPTSICTTRDCLDPGDPGFRNKSLVKMTRSKDWDSMELLWREDVWRPERVVKILLLGEDYTDLQQPVVINTTEAICSSSTIQVQYVFSSRSDPRACYSTTYRVPAPPMDKFFAVAAPVSFTRAESKYGDPDLYDLDFLKNQFLIPRYRSCLQSAAIKTVNGEPVLKEKSLQGRQLVRLAQCGEMEIEYKFFTAAFTKTVTSHCEKPSKDKRAQARTSIHLDSVTTARNTKKYNSSSDMSSDTMQLSTVVVAICYSLVLTMCVLVVALVYVKQGKSRKTAAEMEEVERRGGTEERFVGTEVDWGRTTRGLDWEEDGHDDWDTAVEFAGDYPHDPLNYYYIYANIPTYV